MDCIPYINDLKIEIDLLEELKNHETNEAKKSDMIDLINFKKDLITKCKDSLSKLSNNQNCYRIYLNILNGLKPTRAVEKVADENYYNNLKPTSVSKMWNYYKKMKDLLKR